MKFELIAKKDGKECPLSEISTETFENLKNPKPEPPKLEHGDYGYHCGDPRMVAWDFPTVMESQRHLKMMGYYKGEIDGEPGILTDTAHKRYSNDKCGVLDYRKWVRK